MLVRVNIVIHYPQHLFSITFIQVELDGRWKNLTEVSFSALRNDFPTDAARNHAVAFDQMCLSVDFGTGTTPYSKYFLLLGSG